MTTTQMTNEQITARQLRRALFYLSNQEMTVRELRAKLMDIEKQDEPLKLDFDMWAEIEGVTK